MNILEDLYYGNINPNGKCFDRKSQYAQFVKMVTDNEEKLTAFLNALPKAEEERHLLSQMINAQSELSQFSEIERFVEGSRLGASIMLDRSFFPSKV